MVVASDLLSAMSLGVKRDYA
eukprot:COSAG02_NODE_41356_length_395_cov_1.033784_2_plen_20_part_01